MDDAGEKRRSRRDSVYGAVAQEPISIRLPVALLTRLRARAERERRPLSFLVRTMILTQDEREQQPAGAR